ncbi:response regulator [Bdellovibrionota bacterium FG-1]
MSETILVVDDDQMILQYLEQELKRNFFNTICVGTGKEALLRVHEADVVFLDIGLPDMDGFEVLAQIKAAHGSDAEAIVITGHGNQEVAIRALRMGAIDYIEKPIQLDDLRAALGRAQEMLAKKRNLIGKDTVLVIDDEKIVADKLGKLLEKEGYQVFCSYDGLQAIDFIQKNKVDVVVSDINMKGMDGIAVLTQAKKLFQDIEFIMMTGDSGQEIAVKCLRAGAMEYLTKPVDVDELLWSVQKAVEKIKLSRNSLYRNRELKLSGEIVAKMNQEQERIIQERSAALTQTQAQLVHTSKLATLGEMSAGMAHELNQPLGGISLVAQTMRKLKDRNALTDEELENSIRDIETSVKRISKIIQHVRTFARQEVLKFTLLEVNTTIESAFMLLGEQLKLREIAVVTGFGVDLPKIEGEPYQLEQVWINLISNSRDAMDSMAEECKISQQEYHKKLSISTRVEGEQLLIEVSDNGIGMSEAQKAKIFEPFFTTKPPGRGMGLGMSITYGILESHKATIQVQSCEKKGTTITVSLCIPQRKDI